VPICGPRELLGRDPTHGVPHFEGGEGHKPWTRDQLAFADENFAGMLRRAYVLARYAGQRISDIVDKLRESNPEDGVVWHGLRANAVIRLRQSGRSSMEISDAIGMSVPIVERYTCYADRKAGGKALLLSLAEHKRDKAVKR
jgi:hypothetical protein